MSGSLDATDTITQTIAGADAVLVTLAAGNGVLARFDAAALPFMSAHGPRRIVSMVGAAVRRPGDPDSFSLRLMTAMMRLIPNGLLADAEGHAERLARSGLDWTLVRSANFRKGPAAGPVIAEPAFRMGLTASMSCEDLAAFMLDCAEQDHFVGAAPMVANAPPEVSS